MSRVIFIIIILNLMSSGLSAQDSKCILYRGKSINCLNQDEYRNGYWMFFVVDDTSKSVIAEGNYKNTLKSGIWKYRSFSDIVSETTVLYKNDGGIVFNLDPGEMIVRNDSSLIYNFDELPAWQIRTWCNKCNSSNYYNCIRFNPRVNSYKNKTVLGIVNAMREVFGTGVDELKMSNILEKDSEKQLIDWHVR